MCRNTSVCQGCHIVLGKAWVVLGNEILPPKLWNIIIPVMTCNQNVHIKESNLIMKYSLGKILEKCT